jgi:hypothetical protein
VWPGDFPPDPGEFAEIRSPTISRFEVSRASNIHDTLQKRAWLADRKGEAIYSKVTFFRSSDERRMVRDSRPDLS